jgi:hypothetical protein
VPVPVLPISDGNGNLVDRESESIAPYMAHPTDEEDRQAFVSYMRARSVLTDLPKFSPATKFTLTAEELRLLLKLVLNPNLNAIKTTRGMLVGEMLVCNLICARDHPDLVGVKRTVYAFSGAKRSERSLLDMWIKFHSVAHLWASARYWDGQQTFFSVSEKTNISWVKDPAARLQFLAIAEVFRRMGEDTYAHGQRRRGRPLLDPHETWKVPSDLILPAATIELPEAIPDLLLKKLKKYRAPR